MAGWMTLCRYCPRQYCRLPAHPLPTPLPLPLRPPPGHNHHHHRAGQRAARIAVALLPRHKAALSTVASPNCSPLPLSNLIRLEDTIAPSARFEKKLPAALPDDEPLIQPSILGTAQLSAGNDSPSENQDRLILIDGKAVVYRAYYKLMTKMQYGTLPDTTGEGDWVLTVFTALSTILKIFELTPSHIVVVFDHEGLTFRHTLFSNYKMNRSPTPDTVVQSIKYVKPALIALGIKTIEVPGVEADDVIGTIALNAVSTGTKVRILSPDKDFFQIISPSLRLLRFVPHGSGIVSFGLEEFHERFGDLQPSQYVDVLALMGDKVDNIPGVAGIGEKTAVSLIKTYGSLEKLLEDKENVKEKRALKGLLSDNGEVILSKRLATLRTDLPYYMVPFSFTDFCYRKPKDGGDRYVNLLKAMGSFVEGTFASDLQRRTEKVWSKYS